MRRTIDYALITIAAVKSLLSVDAANKFSGEVVTNWQNGGFRKPMGFDKHPMVANMISSESLIKSLIVALKKEVPCKYTGKAIFKMNGGEVTGKPALVP